MEIPWEYNLTFVHHPLNIGHGIGKEKTEKIFGFGQDILQYDDIKNDKSLQIIEIQKAHQIEKIIQENQQNNVLFVHSAWEWSCTACGNIGKKICNKY